jgi:hypothetical protein
MYEYGTCAFGLKTSNFWGARVGNEDAADLIHDSIARFQWGDKVYFREFFWGGCGFLEGREG